MPAVHRELPGWTQGGEEDMLLLRSGDGKCSTSSPSSSEGTPGSVGGTEDSSSSTAISDASSVALEDEVNDELRFSLTAEALAADSSPSMVPPGGCGRWKVDSHGCVELPSSAQKGDRVGFIAAAQKGAGANDNQSGVRMDREEPDGHSVSSISSCEAEKPDT